MKRPAIWILKLAAAMAVMLFAYANSHVTPFFIDPRNDAEAAFHTPLFFPIMIALIVGMVVGGVLSRIAAMKREPRRRPHE